MNFVLGDLAVFEFAHQSGCAQTHLVQAVTAIDHDRVVGAQSLQGAHLDAYQVGMKNAHQNVGCARRIGQRAQDVEDGFDAQLAAHRAHIFHGRMVVGCEHKTHALFGDALGYLRGRQVDVQAQGFEHVGAAALAADAAPAVLADFGASSGRHKHGAGRDIEGVRTVAAGAHNVHQVRLVRHLNLGGKLAHHLRSCRDLADGFLLDAQAGNECGHHHRRHLAGHDLAHQVQHFVVEDFAVLDGALQRFLRGDLGGVGHGFLLMAGALR